ncbi:MAG: acetylornithine/N-succinyldiaminopimelate aminotransferase [Paraglaciecola sp.]|jgi:acetylornithine/N-succinyldiaminopimelate aminotransferase
MKLFDVYPLFDLEITKGKGSFVWDKNGKKYLDFYGGHAVISIGHSHPRFVKKIATQLQNLAFYSNSIHNPLQVELAQKLGELSNCPEYQLFLVNSGAEANENALKLASFHTKKTKIIAFKNAFHGRTSAAVNVTDNSKIQAPINSLFEREFHEFNQLESVEKSLSKGDVCAVIIEGIQGVGGIHIPNISFLQSLSALCKKQEAILILDEIQSGYGRSGQFFAFQYANIKPDLITIAKGMGNGFPIGGVLIHPKFKPRYGLLGTTFGGNHLACVAALSVLEVIEEESLMNNAVIIGNFLKTQLSTIEGITDIRQQGLMIGLEFEFPIKELRKRLLLEEFIFTGSSSNPNVLRLLPPLNISRNNAFVFVEKLKLVLQIMLKNA